MRLSLSDRRIAVFLFAVIAAVFVNARQSPSAWLPGWKYRMPFVVIEQSGTPLPDHAVRLTLTARIFPFDRCQPDGADIRIADDEGTSYSFWIERWPQADEIAAADSTAEAVLWVRIPSLSAHEKKRLYLYYGNSLADQYSNLSRTMSLVHIARLELSSRATPDGSLDWHEIPFSPEATVEAVIASVPTRNETETATVRLRKENGRWFAALAETSALDGSHSTETVYFIGAPVGDFLLTNGLRMSLKTSLVSATFGPNIATTEHAQQVVAPREPVFLAHLPIHACFASLDSYETSSAQERLAHAVVMDGTGASAFVAIGEEYDNTLPHSVPETVATLFVDSAQHAGAITDASSHSPVAWSLETTESCASTLPVATSLSTSVPAVFAAVEPGDSTYAPFVRLVASSAQPSLVIAADETASGNSQASTVTVTTLSFEREGTFAATSFVATEPLVAFDSISGTVFEDIDCDGGEREPGDPGKAGVRVRLYEDSDRDGLLTNSDRFICETVTDRDGTYHLPAAGNRQYVIAVSAQSIGAADAELLNPQHSASELVPEQISVRNYQLGSFSAEKVPGGVHPFLSDHWSDSVLPSDNVYEHVAIAEIADEETVSGVDFGFSYGLVTSTYDTTGSVERRQGTLRQAIVNANALRGQQRIVFDLFKTDPGFDSVSSQFYFAPVSALPTITDSLVMSGPEDTGTGNDYGVIISGQNIPLADGLVIASPDVRIDRIAIGGFRRGIYVETYQTAQPLFSSEATAALDPSRLYAVANEPTALLLADSDPPVLYDLGRRSHVDSFPIDPAMSGGSLSFVAASALGTETVALVGADDASPRFRFLETPYGALLAGDETVIQASVRDSTAGADAFSASLVSDIEGVAGTGFQTVARVTPRAYGGLYPLYSGKTFVFDCGTGARITLVPATRNGKSLTTPTAIITSSAETTVVEIADGVTVDGHGITVIDAEIPVYALVAGTSSPSYAAVLSPVSTDVAGFAGPSSTIVSTGNGKATACLTLPDGGHRTVEFDLEAGKPVLLASAANLPASLPGDAVFAVRILSSTPLALITPVPNRHSDGVLHFLAGLPSSRLGSAHIVPADARAVWIAVFSREHVDVLYPDGTSESFLLDASPTEPGLARLSRTRIPAGTRILTDGASVVCYDSLVTGGLESAIPNTACQQPDEILVPAGSRDAFDANIVLSNCSFLANRTAVEVRTGNGVSVTGSRFFSNETNIDLAGDGPDVNDGLRSIDQPNEGVDRPLITSAVVFESTLTIEGCVGATESSPTTAFDGSNVALYLSDREGKQASLLLGNATVEEGRFKLVRSVEGLTLTSSDRVVAVLTTPMGSTSEFSDPLRIDPAPIISDVRATHLTPIDETTLEPLITTITWSTDISSTSKVVYDVVSHAATETYAYETTESTELVTTHTVTISGLLPNTIYYFRVISKNIDGDVTTSYEYPIPPGRLEADTDLCAFCHRAHTGIATPLRLLYIRE